MEEGKKAVREHLDMLDSHYLKAGKFVAGSAVPTIADLSIRPCLEFLRAVPIPFSATTQAYLDRFDKHVSSFKSVNAPLQGFIASLGFAPASKPQSAAAIFASWTPAKVQPGPTWKKVPRPQWKNTSRPDIAKELERLRVHDASSKELPVAAAPKDAPKNAPKVASKAAPKAATTDDASTEKFEFSHGHFHYKLCPNDSPEKHHLQGCKCQEKKNVHAKFLCGKASESAGRKYADQALLYVLDISPNSHGTMVLVKEANLNVRVQFLDVIKGETRTPEFLSTNPFHCCPTLEIGKHRVCVAGYSDVLFRFYREMRCLGVERDLANNRRQAQAVCLVPNGPGRARSHRHGPRLATNDPVPCHREVRLPRFGL